MISLCIYVLAHVLASKQCLGKMCSILCLQNTRGDLRSANFLCPLRGASFLKGSFCSCRAAAKFIACGFREVPFLGWGYMAVQLVRLSFSLPSVAHVRLQIVLWEGTTLQSKQGRGSENLLLEYVELTVRRRGRDGHIRRSHVCGCHGFPLQFLYCSWDPARFRGNSGISACEW